MLLAFLLRFNTQYRVTDVTDLDLKDMSLSPVLKIDLVKIKMLLHYTADPDQRRAIVQPAELFIFCQKMLFFAKNIIACFCKRFLIYLQTFVRFVMGIWP